MFSLNVPFRLMFAMVLAFLVTTLLFTVMRLLIAQNQTGALDTSPYTIVEIVKPMKPDELITNRKKVVEKPPEPQVPPHVSLSTIPPGKTFTIYSPPLVIRDSVPRLTIGGLQDGSFLPIVKVQPNYPRRALVQGIEGYVVVEFDIGPDGSVRKPRVIEHYPNDIFDNSAIKAALKFKYKPQITNGVSEHVMGVRNRFTFEISG